MIHETLAYAAFRAVGVPAPRTGYAYVRVNGEDYGVYLDVETLDDVALRRRFPTTQHLYEGEYTDDVRPGGADAFAVDEGSETDRSDLEALIAAVNGNGPLSEQVRPLADLTEMTQEWAVERYIGHWDGYAGWDDSAYREFSPFGGFSPNNYFLHSDASGRFSMLPWGADQTWSPFLLPEGVRPVGFDDGQAIMFTQVPGRPRLRSALPRRRRCEPHPRSARSVSIRSPTPRAALLRPWQELDPRREATLAEIDAGVAGVHEFMRGRAAEAAAWLTPPVVTGVPDRVTERGRLVHRAGDHRLAGGRRQRPGDRPARHHRLDRRCERRLFERAELRHLIQLRDRIAGAQHRLGRSVARADDQPGHDRAARDRRPRRPTRPTRPPASRARRCESVRHEHRAACARAHVHGDRQRRQQDDRVRQLRRAVQDPRVLFADDQCEVEARPDRADQDRARRRHRDIASPDAEAQGLLSPTCRVTFVATGAQSASACMKYDTANHQFTYNWKLGQPIGGVTISVQVGYAGTTTKTILSVPITITR